MINHKVIIKDTTEKPVYYIKNNGDEYIVKCLINGKLDESKCYYTDDEQDAIDTMNIMKKSATLIYGGE